MEDKKNGTVTTGGIFKGLEYCLKLIKKHGVLNVLVSTVLLTFFLLLGYVLTHPADVLEKIESIQLDRHKGKIARRLDNDPKIRMTLKDILAQTQASSVGIIEFHNGNSNLNGLPFLYGSMKYEEINQMEHMDYDYQNMSLSRYPFISNLYKTGVWIGGIDELSQVDTRFSYNLKASGIECCAFILIHGANQDIGILCLAFAGGHQHQDHERVLFTMRKNVQILSSLLSF